MRIASAIILLSLLAGTVAAQEKPSPLDDLFKSAEQWARDNLDDHVLDALKKTDQDRTRALFNELNRRLQNDNVYDLGALKESATALLPLLQQSKETRPYALWLQTHLDYLDASGELRRRMQRPPPKPGAPAPPPASPTPEAQRTVWDGQMEKRPTPVGAQTYVPRLKPLFVAGGVPAELVWLAEVESSFNPEARSPVGAAGLFQFMPTTARSLGLALSPQDERLNPEKSARAAAKYLRYLYGRFGDWRLTFAAYNAGETRVANLLTQYKTRSFYAIAPRLPAETQLYVPKIEATIHKREGLALTGLQLPRG
jgi:membrane-bound lytic murein transglycosylase D